MSPPDPITAAESPRALAELNRWLATQTRRGSASPGRLANLAGGHALSSSFGAQAAVSLHMVTRQKPDIPVILIDTGYLFPETYRFVDELTERLSLNLKVYRPQIGIAWMEARFGKLWEQGARRHRPLQPLAQGRTDAARAARTRRAHLDRRHAPQPVAQPRRHRLPAAARRPLEAASARRLERSRCLGLSAAPRPALPPAVARGLRLDRRRPHHASAAKPA